MTIFYPDISSAQEGISLKGTIAVCCKATQGTSYTNPDYKRAESNATLHDSLFFAYHFLEAGNAGAQAQHCHSVVGKTPLMLDVEITGGSHPNLGDVCEFVDTFRKKGGTCWLVYLPRWYWGDMGSPSLQPLINRGLRLVSSAYTGYSDSDSATGWQPYGGMTPVIWQYTSSVSFGGFKVDFNAFRGTHPGNPAKQSSATVAETLKQFKSIVRTGKMPVVADPVRHEVAKGNTLSLEGLARSRNTTVEHLAEVTFANLNPANQAIWNAYAALDKALHDAGKPRPALPEGFVYYTSA